MRTIIIGAGFAGLSAARKLKGEYLVLEASSRPGGLCRTEIKDGFTFDYTGHLMHLRHRDTEKFILKNTPVRMNKIARVSKIFSSGAYTDYPYQANSHGLPGPVISENITGFLDAKEKNSTDASNFKSWVLSALGTGIAKNFMFPYNLKLWNYPLEKLTVKWLGRFVPNPGVPEVMDGLVESKERKMGYNAHFYYPSEGGIESVINGIAAPIRDKILLNNQVTKVSLKNKKVFCGKQEFSYDRLIVTMPLKQFLELADDARLKKQAKALKATTVFCVNVGFTPSKEIKTHWIYVPEKEYPFYRVGFPHTFARGNAPKGCASVFAEVSFNERQAKALTKAKLKAKEKEVLRGLVKMGVIPSIKSVKTVLTMMLPGAYVIYDKERQNVPEKILPELEKKGVYGAGRWGSWEYSSMEDAVLEGFAAAEKINK